MNPPNSLSFSLPIDLQGQNSSGSEPREAEQARWFRETIQPHEPKLRAYLRKHFAAITETDDIIQETYMRLFRAQRSGKTLLPSYVYSIAHNTALDWLRRRRIVAIDCMSNLERLPALSEQTVPHESVARAEELEILRHAIAALPERCRLIMTLQRIQGRSNKEIADRLGISIHTVNAQIVIGLARCRDYLRERGILQAYLG